MEDLEKIQLLLCPCSRRLDDVLDDAGECSKGYPIQVICTLCWEAAYEVRDLGESRKEEIIKKYVDKLAQGCELK